MNFCGRPPHSVSLPKGREDARTSAAGYSGVPSPLGEKDRMRGASAKQSTASWDLHNPPPPWHCQARGAISAGQANPGFTAAAARTICKQGCDLAGEPMTDYAPLKLHVPEPAVRPGDTPDFSNVRIAQRRLGARPEVDADPEVDPRSRLFDHPRAQPRRRGGRPLGRPLDRRGVARGPARHDDVARLRRTHGDGAAAGQDLVLHAAHGRRGGQLRLSARRSCRAT